MLRSHHQKGSLPTEAETSLHLFSQRVIEDLILSCDKPVRRLAHTYAWDAHDVDMDDLYMAGMTTVCVWAKRAYTRARDPIAYLCRAAQHAMLNELKRIHRETTISLDAPLSDDHACCLADLLAAQAYPSVSGTPSPRVQALRAALPQLSLHQRSVLQRLYDFSGGHMHREVGRELRMNRGTVNHHAVMGRKRLRTDAALCAAVGVEPLLNVVKSQNASVSMQSRSEYAR